MEAAMSKKQEKINETAPLNMEYTEKLLQLLEIQSKLSPGMRTKMDCVAESFLNGLKADADNCAHIAGDLGTPLTNNRTKRLESVVGVGETVLSLGETS